MKIVVEDKDVSGELVVDLHQMFTAYGIEYKVE